MASQKGSLFLKAREVISNRRGMSTSSAGRAMKFILAVVVVGLIGQNSDCLKKESD
jgi:hypothetical protein